MGETKFDDIFTEDALNELFPSRRSDDFFEALLGDASAGAYDISLKYQGYNSVQKNLTFELHLRERPGKCLACNLTYGLPKVFGAHPVINIKGEWYGKSIECWTVRQNVPTGHCRVQER